MHFYEKQCGRSLEIVGEIKAWSQENKLGGDSTTQLRVKDASNQYNSSRDGENWPDLRVIHQQNKLDLVMTYLDVCGKEERNRGKSVLTYKCLG